MTSTKRFAVRRSTKKYEFSSYLVRIWHEVYVPVPSPASGVDHLVEEMRKLSSSDSSSSSGGDSTAKKPKLKPKNLPPIPEAETSSASAGPSSAVAEPSSAATVSRETYYTGLLGFGVSRASITDIEAEYLMRNPNAP